MSAVQTKQGRIVQCIGAVIDIQFPREAMPNIYDALTLVEEGESFAEKGLTFEVEQQLGDGVVRSNDIVTQHSGLSVFAGVGERTREGNDFYHEMSEAKVIVQEDLSKSKVAMVFGQMNEPPGNRLRVALSGLTMAESFRDEGRDILLFIDTLYRFTLGA